jgi:hypothetical protein
MTGRALIETWEKEGVEYKVYLCPLPPEHFQGRKNYYHVRGISEKNGEITPVPQKERNTLKRVLGMQGFSIVSIRKPSQSKRQEYS